jgi:DNA-binding CsgD family transcriptional regulator
MPYRRALAELGLARIALDVGGEAQRERAHHLLLAADETFTRLGAAESVTTAGLLRRRRWMRPAVGTADGLLSLREQEVAALASTGLTNQEIAERMVLSRRTVENHLARIYVKTGVHNRAGLAAMMFAHN